MNENLKYLRILSVLTKWNVVAGMSTMDKIKH